MHVLALASSTGDWRASVQAASSQRAGMDGQETVSTKKGSHLARSMREQIWTTCVKNEFDLGNSIQTRVASSCVIAAMDRVGGWICGNEEGSQIWSQTRGVSVDLLTQRRVICDGQRHMETFRINKENSIMEGNAGNAGKPRFWRHYIMISMSRALCSGVCCGYLRQKALTKTR